MPRRSQKYRQRRRPAAATRQQIRRSAIRDRFSVSQPMFAESEASVFRGHLAVGFQKYELLVQGSKRQKKLVRILKTHGNSAGRRTGAAGIELNILLDTHLRLAATGQCASSNRSQGIAIV